MGDDTPEQEGFLSLNPLVHIDFLGTLFLMLYKFGWSKFIPINPFNMHGKYRLVKVLTAFSAQTWAHLMLALFSLITLIGLFGEKVLNVIFVQPLSQSFPESSSYILAIALIVISMLVVNTILAVTSFLINMCGVAVMFFVEKHPQYMLYTSLIMLVVPLLVFYLFGTTLILFIFSMIQMSGYYLATLLHLC